MNPKALKSPSLLLVTIFLAGAASAQESTTRPTFAGAAQEVKAQLEQAMDELDALRGRLAEEQVPAARNLAELEAELSGLRAEFQETTKSLDGSTLDLGNLREDIKKREEEVGYLSNLFGTFARDFESRLHIVEKHRHEKAISAAKLAVENTGLDRSAVFAAQMDLIDSALGRIEDVLGGTKFEGTAVDAEGRIQNGVFVLVGPAAVFRSADGKLVGTAEQRLGSLEPAIVGFGLDEAGNGKAVDALVAGAGDVFPIDPTLGNAHKIESTQESRWEHIKKGGPIMVPIFVLAGAALLVVIYKWLRLSFVRKASSRRIHELLDAVSEHDRDAAAEVAGAIGGPTGRMLSDGVEHIEEPTELIEEIMFETVLATRLDLNRMLPFVAISASAAPLLGLLGTVTGIMNTFKLITVFGTGDVKTLSSGISEALITTEYGLIVAIPSLLMHAFLSRKAKGIIDQMEKAAMAFVNQVTKTPMRKPATAGSN